MHYIIPLQQKSNKTKHTSNSPLHTSLSSTARISSKRRTRGSRRSSAINSNQRRFPRHHGRRSSILGSLISNTPAIKARVVTALRGIRTRSIVRSTNHSSSGFLVCRGDCAFSAICALGSGITTLAERNKTSVGTGRGASHSHTRRSRRSGRGSIGKISRRSQEAIAQPIVASIGCALRVVLAFGIVFAALCDLHKVAGVALGSSSTLCSVCTVGAEGKCTGVCDDGGRGSWQSSLSVNSSDCCSESEERGMHRIKRI